MSKPHQTIAWLGVIFALISALYFLTREDIQEALDVRDIFMRKQVLLDRLEQLPAREQLIKRRLADLGNEAASQNLYKGDHNSIQSLMQRDIRELASNSSVRIVRMTSARQSRSPQRLAASTVQLSLNASYENLINFVAGIEASEPLLIVGKLTIRVQRASTRTDAAQLNITAEVSGFRDTLDIGR